MTAEIAILNRAAVALAADSAVTIDAGGAEKIYNSAEKIFEFSRQCPVGLMIYNSLDYMGFPWDVLIREHRSRNDCAYEELAQAATAFRTFLSALNVEDVHEDRYLYDLLSDVYDILFDRYQDRLTKEVAASTKGAGVDGQKNFHLAVEEFTAFFAHRLLAGYLANKMQDDFDKRYGRIADEAAAQCFAELPLKEPEFALLRQLAFSVVRSTAFLGYATGLVFAGYAKDDLFPTLHAIQVDGQFFGEMKWWETDNRAVDREDERAIILPFAEREMVDRFVHGIDEDFERLLTDYMKDASSRLVQKIIDFANSGAKRRRIVVPPEFINDLSEEFAAELREELLPELKGLNLRDIYDLVTAMPKAELATMAEALVSITSMKRKVSLQLESVGGPVDVALITRSEGFVWIRRKLYFGQELNPGFLNRHYKQGPQDRRQPGERAQS